MMKARKLLSILMILTLLLAATACSSSSGEYPNKNITVLIPRSPGGPTDTSSRAVLEALKGELPSGVSFVPTNKPDGNGIAAMVEGARASADGYTLTMLVCEAAMLPHVGRMETTVADYRAIAVTNADPLALVVKADAPYDTIEEFIAYAQAHPGEVTVGNAGTGSLMHLAALNVEQRCGVEFMHVPYHEGTGPIIAAIAGGHLDACFGAPTASVSQVAAGELKALGIMDVQRVEVWPDVPTFKEALDIEFTHLAWATLCAPKDTPDDVVDYLIGICQDVMETEAFREQMRTLGIEPVSYYGADADRLMQTDSEIYAPLMQGLDLEDE